MNIGTIVGFVALVAAVGALMYFAFRSTQKSGGTPLEQPNEPEEEQQNKDSSPKTFVVQLLPAADSGTQKQVELRYEDLKVGTGPVAENGDIIRAHYTGMLEDGTVFDTSYPRGTPYEFPLGARQVIAGWDIGLVGMRVGGTRTLVIPPELAYGEEGRPPVIPPNATLIFEIELLSIVGK